MGRAHDRTVVAVTEGEGIGQCVVVGKVRPGVVAHGEGPLGRALELRSGVDAGERVHLPAVPAQVLGLPVVGEVEGAVGHVGRDGIEPERQQTADRRRARCSTGRPGRTRRGRRPGGRRSLGHPDSCRSSGRRTGSPSSGRSRARPHPDPNRPGRPWPPSPPWKRPPPGRSPRPAPPPPRRLLRPAAGVGSSPAAVLHPHPAVRSCAAPFSQVGSNVSVRMAGCRNPGSPAALPGRDRHPITGFGPASGDRRWRVTPGLINLHGTLRAMSARTTDGSSSGASGTGRSGITPRGCGISVTRMKGSRRRPMRPGGWLPDGWRLRIRPRPDVERVRLLAVLDA